MTTLPFPVKSGVTETGPELRKWLVENFPDMCGRIHLNNVPGFFEDYLRGDCKPCDFKPYMWVGRSTVTHEKCLDERGGRPERENFDLEIVGLDPAFVQRQAIHLHCKQGFIEQMGDMKVQGLYVDDQSDDYQIRNSAEGSGLEIVAFDIEIIHQDW